MQHILACAVEQPHATLGHYPLVGRVSLTNLRRAVLHACEAASSPPTGLNKATNVCLGKIDGASMAYAIEALH